MPESFIEKMPFKRYSHKTIKSYRTMFREFINYYPSRLIDAITEQEILAYLRYLVQERAVLASYQNQAINAIKFYYEQVLHGNRKLYYTERPEKEPALPVVLSEPEVQATLKGISNLKHKCILLVLYSAGLRIGELLTLAMRDIDADRMQIHAKGAKEGSDHSAFGKNVAVLAGVPGFISTRTIFVRRRTRKALFAEQRAGYL